MIYIRSMEKDAPRTGEWAHLFYIQHDSDGKDIWIVEFPDGATDAWPSWNHLAEYDVKVQIESPIVEEDNGNHSEATGGTALDSARLLLSQGIAKYQAR